LRSGLAAALALVARVAAAEPVTVSVDDVDLRIDLPAGWDATPPPELPAGRALAAYASAGRRLVIARLRASTEGAYAARPAYFAGIEDGVRQESPGYQRLAGGARKLGKRPAYDLWYRAGGAVHGARFIFLRGLVVVARLELPDARAVERGARHLLESFKPQ
jgi:hypothetical protein